MKPPPFLAASVKVYIIIARRKRKTLKLSLTSEVMSQNKIGLTVRRIKFHSFKKDIDLLSILSVSCLVTCCL